MEIVRQIAAMKEFVRRVKNNGATLGLVPTMGSLHEGHLSLMRQAKAVCDVVAASIFVNPIQFGAGEDYETYPRDLSRDAAVAEGAGVDVIFAPPVQEMYPRDFISYVEVTDITSRLCGASRPGHFRGVTTVVNKLFNIVQPDQAFFGQKDAQQVAVIKQMVKDLNMNVKIVTGPIMRETDGLAMSSRNIYLTEEERKAALVLSRSLGDVRRRLLAGERDAGLLRVFLQERITAEPLADIDYISICEVGTLKETDIVTGSVLIALAVRFGKTRLIDNLVWEG
ncbi:MAG TPA: pantoate--beta-alanine ligase [Firmicutes bacterium]|nr:pantoate--beta-alanine ligase [Bacillota bacterium]HWR55170.1 pantoate--beta-alanine ligase [Negativicutes bacterium]